MMHFPLIFLALMLAAIWRVGVPLLEQSTWSARWNLSLAAFVVPPLLLLMTAVAIVTMGAPKEHSWEGWCSYGLSAGFLASAILYWSQLVWQSRRMRQRLKALPERTLQAAGGELIVGRVMNTPVVFSAQTGLWNSQLVVSEGLIARLDEEQLAAVLAHELGHAHYRDTFWFFWLGGLKRLTCWLPRTEALWQELMLLREIRADSWAAQKADFLILAESLMSVVTAPLMETEAIYAGFSCAAPRSRLAQRVDALLLEDAAARDWMSWWQGLAILVALSPLVAVPFHY